MTDLPGLVGLVDLTTLDERDTEQDVRALCAKAATPIGPVAAVCVLSRLAAVAVEASPVAVAVTVNFPAGEDDVEATVEEARRALAAGVDELDVVVPWRAALDGDTGAVGRMVAACREALDADGASDHLRLKAILETGSHPDLVTTRRLADDALAAGADFVKTSTGKVGPGASPDAARVLLEAVRDAGRGGLKVSGGVRTVEDAHAYVALADELLGEDEVTAERFRIGASGLLDALLAEADAERRA